MVEHRHAGDGQFLEVGGEGCLRADGADEGVPAVGYGGVVQEGEVEGEEGTGGATRGDAGVDGLVGLGGRGGGGVGDAHFGGEEGGEGVVGGCGTESASEGGEKRLDTAGNRDHGGAARQVG